MKHNKQVYADRAKAIIAELDRRYHITRDALFIDLMHCGIEYAAASFLEGMESGDPDPDQDPQAWLTDPENPDSPAWSDYI